LDCGAPEGQVLDMERAASALHLRACDRQSDEPLARALSLCGDLARARFAAALPWGKGLVRGDVSVYGSRSACAGNGLGGNRAAMRQRSLQHDQWRGRTLE